MLLASGLLESSEVEVPIRLCVPDTDVPDTDHREVWIRADSEGLLSPAIRIVRGAAEPREIHLQLRPAATLELALERKGLGTDWQPAGANVTQLAGSEMSDSLCELSEPGLRCRVLAGRGLGFRVQIDEFVPWYFWRLDLTPGEVKRLGPLHPRAGASIAGWVVTPDPQQVESGTVTATLEVYRSGWLGDPTGHASGLELSRTDSMVNELGFFQIGPIPPGSYSLTVAAAGLPSETIAPLLVGADSKELILEAPIELQSPRVLEVAITPPIGPGGLPWRVKLLPLPGGSGRRSQPYEGEAALTGWWRVEGIGLGRHVLLVEDAAGSRWWTGEVEVVGSDSFAQADIDLVEIEGLVTMGDDPLETGLRFVTEERAKTLSFVSDVDGHFAGYLPHEGEWWIELTGSDAACAGCGSGAQLIDEPEQIRARDDGRPTKVRIEVPDTLVRGRVVLDGAPIPGAVINMFRPERSRERHGPGKEGDLMTNEQGSFELRGAAPGVVILQAEHGGATSGPVPVQVTDNPAGTDVEIELMRRVAVSGRVVGPGGPLPGALVMSLPSLADGGAGMGVSTRTELDGRFELQVPATSRWLPTLVAAPEGIRLVSLPPPDRLAGGANAGALITLGRSGGGTLATRSASPDELARATLHYQNVSFPVGAMVGLLAQGFQLARTEDGYVLSGMEPGRYQLCSDSGRCGPGGELTPGGVLTLELPASR